MAEDLPEIPLAFDKLSEQHQLFVIEFCKHGNGTKAAKAAGYKGRKAANQAWRLRINEDIKAAIAQRLMAASLGALETTKQISDVAQTRLNDYFTIKQVQGIEQAEQYVTVLAAAQRDEIAYIQEFSKRQGMPLLDKNGLTKIGQRMMAAQEKLLEYELDIQRHGNEVTRLAAGKPAVHQVAELDIVKLAKAKEGGRIKSYSLGKDGLKVETYDALGALDKLARMHGLYEKDNRQMAGTDVEIIIGGEDEAEAQA